MEDAPGKPDPQGLFDAVQQLEAGANQPSPVIYVGDTVADMYTIDRAREKQPDRPWVGVGILPPHVQETSDRRSTYAESLRQAGAEIVLANVQELTAIKIQQLMKI